MKRSRNDSECESIASNEESVGSPPGASARKKRRGIIEKRRRDRINSCMTELRRLVPQANEREGSMKLEKAELLQMTVEHLRTLKQQNGVLKDKSNANPVDYRAFGFRECVGEVSRYLSNTERMDLQHPLRHRLITHLQRVCATRSISSPNIPLSETEAIASRLQALPQAASHNTPPSSPANEPCPPPSSPDSQRENKEPSQPTPPTVPQGADSTHPFLPKGFPLQAVHIAPQLVPPGPLPSFFPLFGPNGQLAALTSAPGFASSQLAGVTHPQLTGFSAAQLAAAAHVQHLASQLSANPLAALTPNQLSDLPVFTSSSSSPSQLNIFKNSSLGFTPAWGNTALLNGNVAPVV